MSEKKRTYIAPILKKFESVDELPDKIRSAAAEILNSQPPLLVTVDNNRQYLEVSEEFARLLGYTARDLVGKRVDDITVRDILDLDFSFRVVRRFGEAKGLWLFEARDGKPLLCSYYARRINSKFQAELRPINLAA